MNVCPYTFAPSSPSRRISASVASTSSGRSPGSPRMKSTFGRKPFSVQVRTALTIASTSWPRLLCFSTTSEPDCPPMMRLSLSTYFFSTASASFDTCSGRTSEGKVPKYSRRVGPSSSRQAASRASTAPRFTDASGEP